MSARWFIGCMSGTSIDGVDVAMIESDGETISGLGTALGRDYAPQQHDLIAAAVARAIELGEKRDDDPAIVAASKALTDQHIQTITALIATSGVDKSEIAAIGFHGQTVLHRPEKGLTWQIGDAQALADALGLPVVCDMRLADVAAGGQGAPLAPLYHHALATSTNCPTPLAVLNLGGVGNLTLIGESLTAFDTGPANGLIDLWVRKHGRGTMDEGGFHAGRGQVDEARLSALMANPWFDAAPPKSLDRHDFTIDAMDGLEFPDGCATLTAFTAETVARALQHVSAPKLIAVTGGGRHNETMMMMVQARTGIPAVPVEQLGWRGDVLEAEAFGFLAARSLAGLPLSVPGTTGVPEPMTGGRVVHPST